MGRGSEGHAGVGMYGKGREEAEGGERVGKGEGSLDLDICPGAPEFLVTPLSVAGSAHHHSIFSTSSATGKLAQLIILEAVARWLHH